MKLHNGRYKKPKVPTVKTEEFMASLKRFAKEFGIYPVLINSMDNYYRNYDGYSKFKNYISFCDFWAYKLKGPLKSNISMFGLLPDIDFEEISLISSLWEDWAQENHDYSHLTILT